MRNPDSLFDDLFKPALWFVSKLVFYIGVIALVWICSGIYTREQLDIEVREAIDLRVVPECQRPAWVKTKLDAREYDLTVEKMELVGDKLDLLSRRTDDLRRKAAAVEEIQRDLTGMRTKSALWEATLRSRSTRNMGGPSPKAKPSKLDTLELSANGDAGR